MFKDMCTKCEKRKKCTTLCNKADKYASQDRVGQGDESINPKGDVSEMFANTSAKEWPELKENTHLTPTDKEVVTLLSRGLNRKDVCQVLEISRQTLRKRLSRMRKKLLK